MKIADGGYDPVAGHATPAGAGVLAATDARDAMGRVTTHTEYLGDGTSIAYTRTATYDNKSQVTSDSTVSIR